MRQRTIHINNIVNKPSIRRTMLSALMLVMLVPIFGSRWTILVYMAADNNLSENAYEDINSMESVPLPAGVNVIVQADFAASSIMPAGYRFRIRQDDSPMVTSPVLADMGEINSADPQVMNDFIRWGFDAYPSEYKMLVIWSHGSSWYKSPNDKWICPDESTQQLMSIANGDLQRALRNIPQLDILLFDACGMQTIEVLTEVAAYTDYVIGSEDTVPATGFPYQTILPLFDLPLAEIVAQIPLRYTESYDVLGCQNPGLCGLPVTCSSVRTDLLSTFIDAWDDFSRQFRTSAETLLMIREQCLSMNDMDAEVDLMEFLSRSAQNPWDADIRAAAAVLKDLWMNCIVSYSVLEYTHPIGTAAIWFPQYRVHFEGWWAHYRKLSFARRTEWLSLLNLAYGADLTPPEAPVISRMNVVLATLHLEFTQAPDPDPLTYHITLQQGDDLQQQTISPDRAMAAVLVSFSVSQDGQISISAEDLSGNLSELSTASYQYSAPQTTLIMTPNPVFDPQMAVLRWYADLSSPEPATLAVYDIRGRQVIQRSLGAVTSGESMFFLGADPMFRTLTSGRYFTVIRLGGRSLKTGFTIIK